MKKDGTLMEILTPHENFYLGHVDMLVVTTTEGEEGFLADHVWCCKLLAEEGSVKIHEMGAEKQDIKKARLKGGYVDIKDHFVIYTEDAQWEK